MSGDILRLGHGWLLQPKTFPKRYSLDRFVINRRDGGLELSRSSKGFLFGKESIYSLTNSSVGPLRRLDQTEYSLVVSSELSHGLPETFTICDTQCFDLDVVVKHRRKSFTVIGKFNETVWNVYRILTSKSWIEEGEPRTESVCLQDLFGSVSDSPSEEEESPAALFTRLSMTMDPVPEDSVS